MLQSKKINYSYEGLNCYRYRYGFNGKERDNEIKGQGKSYDFGARIYDPRVGRWLSVDPEFRSYAPISPYAAFINNPIIVIDPDGKKVKVMSEDAFNVLLSSLSPEAREKIKVNKKGFIKRSSVKTALKLSNSENLKALYTLVKDKRTIELYTTKEEYDYINSETGETKTNEFKAPSRENTFQRLLDGFKGTPEEKDKYAEQLKNIGFEDKVTVNGNFGATLRPKDEQAPFPGGQISPGENIRVYVNPIETTGEEKAGNVGHELFGHTYFYIIGKDGRHGGASGKRNGNPELEQYINDREQESKKNFNKQ